MLVRGRLETWRVVGHLDVVDLLFPIAMIILI
jgi:hypothetical protein